MDVIGSAHHITSRIHYMEGGGTANRDPDTWSRSELRKVTVGQR